MKKLTGLLLCLLLALGMCTAWSEEENVWQFDSENLVITDYTGAGGDVVIPGTIGNNPVLKIGVSAFRSDDNITSLTIPDSVTYLDDSAISFIQTIQSVKLSSSLIMIGDTNFYDDDTLAEVAIPASVSYIGSDSFSGCDNLKKVTFTGVCPYFAKGNGSFMSLPSDAVIYVPDDQLDQYKAAFEKMGVYTSVQPSGAAAVVMAPYFNESEVDFDAATGTITLYRGFNDRLDIPDQIGGVPVKAIGPKAFQGHRYLAYVTLPEGLEVIGDNAFEDCWTLRYVSFPSTLKSIGNYAFNRAYKNSELILPAGLQSIGDYAFSYCSTLRGTLMLPEGLETIGNNAFEVNWLSRVYFPSTLKSIGENAFKGTGLTYLYMEGLILPEIAPTAFAESTGIADLDLNPNCTKQQMLDMQAVMDNMGLSCRVWRFKNPHVEYARSGESKYDFAPGSTDKYYFMGYTGEQTHICHYTNYSNDGTNYYAVTGVADGAFKGNQVVQYFAVDHSDLVTYIGAEAFADSVLQHVDLFDSVTTIGPGAFRNCVYLEELTIPESVASIGAGAFDGCTGLKKVNILCDASLIPANSFANCPQLTEAYVAKGNIPAGCFQSSALSSLTLGDGVTGIGENALAYTQLPGFSVSANMDVAPSALMGLPLNNVKLYPEATDEMVETWSAALGYPWYNRILREGEESVFKSMPYEPAAEANFTIDPATGYITGYTGADVEVVIPRTVGGVTVTGLDYNAFAAARDYTNTETMTDQTDWLHLKSVVIPETVTFIHDSVFSYCQQLETVICYGPLESTGRSTFALCRNLKNVVFVNGVKVIGGHSFEECDLSGTVYFGNHVDLIEERAFFRCKMAELAVNAKTVVNRAVNECANLTAVHLTDRIESMEMAAVAECTALNTVCFETPDLSFAAGDGIIFLPSANLTVRTPAEITEEMMKKAQYCVVWSDPMPAVTLVTDACPRTITGLPDVDKVLKSESSVSAPSVPEAPAPEVPVPEEPSENPASAGGVKIFEQKYLCVGANTNGVEMDANSLGGEWSFMLHEEGNKVDFTMAGANVGAMMPLTWNLVEDTYTFDYAGISMKITFTDTGAQLNYMDIMNYIFEPVD